VVDLGNPAERRADRVTETKALVVEVYDDVIEGLSHSVVGDPRRESGVGTYGSHRGKDHDAL